MSGIKCPKCGSLAVSYDATTANYTCRDDNLCGHKGRVLDFQAFDGTTVWISQEAVQAMLAAGGRYQVTHHGSGAYLQVLQKLVDWKDKQVGVLADLIEEGRKLLTALPTANEVGNNGG